MVLVLVVAIGLAALMVHDSPHGVGVGFDSAHYLSAAAQLRDGDGLDVSFTSAFQPLPTDEALATYGEVPLTHYPPGYPAMLALADLMLPGGGRTAARAIGAGAVLLTVLLAAALLQALGARGAVVVAGALAVGVAPALQRLSMWALSDAIGAAVALSALGVMVGRGRLRTRTRRPWTPAVVELVAGALAAAAVCIRYGGIGAAVAVAVLAFDHAARPRAHLGMLARTVGPSFAALVTIFVVNAARGPQAARPVVWHPPDRTDLDTFTDTVGFWLLGNRGHRTATLAALVVAALAGGALWWFVRRAVPHEAPATRTTPPSPRRVAVALAVFGAVQLAVLLLTSALLDADVSFDRRLMYPTELAVVLLVVGIVAVAPRRATSVALCLAIVVLERRMSAGPYPQGLSVPDGAPPEAIFEVLDREPPERIIATSVPEFVWAATGRASIVAPSAYDKLRDRPNPRYETELVTLGRAVGARGGVLLIQRIESPRLTRPSDVERLLPCASIRYEDAQALLYDLTPCA